MHAFLGRWSAAPDAPLFADSRDPGRWWTNAEFEEATRRGAARLLAAGLERGDRVLWSPGARVESLVAHVASLRAGLVVVPVNPASSAAEVAALVVATAPRAAVLPRRETAAQVEEASPRPVLVVGPALELADPPAEPAGLDVVGPEDPALIGLTSGTTGRAKGALLRHGQLLAGAEALRWAWRWSPDDRLVHCLPLFHSHGLCVGAYGTMAAGASALLLERFDPAEVADAGHRSAASLFFGVPTMYHRLVVTGRVRALRRLRLCVSGSAPLPAALHARASAALGAPVLERYGMTETTMLTSNPCDGERRAGTVGFPLPGVEVGLGEVAVGPGAGPGGDGTADPAEVLVRGPNVFDEYVGQPAATAAAFVAAADGGAPWFRTGDLATVEDGYLVIRGRSKELIISGGYNVHPSEVEAALAGCPGVAEVAVTGTPSEEWGEVVTAWVVADGRPPTLEELARHAAASLAPYKQPRLLHVVAELPRTAMGKVARARLGAGVEGGRP